MVDIVSGFPSIYIVFFFKFYLYYYMRGWICTVGTVETYLLTQHSCVPRPNCFQFQVPMCWNEAFLWVPDPHCAFPTTKEEVLMSYHYFEVAINQGLIGFLIYYLGYTVFQNFPIRLNTSHLHGRLFEASPLIDSFLHPASWD